MLTASSTPDPTRELLASGRVCANGKYVGLGFTPWDGGNGTAWASNKTSYTYFRIDTASTPGYVTAA